MESRGSIWTGVLAKAGALHFGSGARRDRESAFLEQVRTRIKGDETVLDVGAGTGFLSLEVAKMLTNGRILALDLSEDMLEQLRRRAEREGAAERIDLLHADVASTGLPDGSVDVVVSMGLLHELRQPLDVVRETVRALKLSGVVLVKDYRGTLLSRLMVSIFHREDEHGPFGVAELDSLFREAGLHDVVVVPEGNHLVGVGEK